MLIAGATGAGKASLLWGLVRAMFPLMQTGLVRVLAADPKLMELAYGRIIFDSYGAYAADVTAIAAMLDRAVADMQDRARRFAGRQRDHTPTIADPFTVVLVDEVAFLTAYQPDRNLKARIMSALATLTTQGRAVGYCVVAALQDPRKDVLTIRNLFPDRIAMRLDEPEQVDMVLGRWRPGPRRGLRADLPGPGCRCGGGVRPAGVRPGPGAGPRRMGHRLPTSATWPTGASPIGSTGGGGVSLFYLGAHQPHWLWTARFPLFVSHRQLARRRRTAPPRSCRWALDSGGFTELSLHGRWVTPAADYAAAVAGTPASSAAGLRRPAGLDVRTGHPGPHRPDRRASTRSAPWPTTWSCARSRRTCRSFPWCRAGTWPTTWPAWTCTERPG